MKADHMIGNTHSKNTGAKDTLIQIGSHVNTQAGYFLFYGFFFLFIFCFGMDYRMLLSRVLHYLWHMCAPNAGLEVLRGLLSDSVHFADRINIKVIEEI